KVAKHGNRSASGKCGSADVLEELGVNLDVSPEKVSECIDKIGIGFLFAPKLHGAMKHAIGPRKEIGIRTVFNILGPLTNPAGAAHQLLGVYDSSLTEKMANVLKSLGAKRALVVHGEDGLDEVTITGKTKVAELKDGNILTYDIGPADFNISLASSDDLKGGTPAENARIALDILNGNKGPKRDIVVINSAAALYAAGITQDIRQGVEKASLAIDSGKAMEKLEQLKKMTNA
ncbi:MAG: anthranilate phosphoribosyltransferase, partial [Nanoarchaeota archaeon]|nr:anthranilate phosphoribosyltransferase [Nanoarchaeota archaeon]